MKRIYICLVVLIPAALCPAVSPAQFLKNLVNNVKQNMANKAVGNGKPDSTGAGKPMFDSTALARMMTRASKPKPSISSADSAAAIKSFMTATGGSGTFYQFRVTYTFKIRNKDSVSSDTMSTAITDGHNTRSDIGLMGGKMDVIGHAGMPRYSILLYPERKSYVFNIIDTASINSADGAAYQVVKVGNEKAGGYNCIHSRMTIGSPGSKTAITEDVWTSPDVPGYAMMEKMMSMQNVTPKMMAALDQAGCGGFFVKVQAAGKDFSMNMQLVTVDRRTFPASMFEIPSGYTASNGQSLFVNALLPKQK